MFEAELSDEVKDDWQDSRIGAQYHIHFSRT